MITLFGKPEPTLLERLKESVGKTRSQLAARVEDLLAGDRQIDPALLAQLEIALLAADLGVRTTREILQAVRDKVERRALADGAQLKTELKNQLLGILSGNGTALPAAANPTRAAESAGTAAPRVIFVVGVNGTGKTTTIGKLAKRLGEGGAKVTLAAGDTFRAAAIEQLKVWADRAHAQFVATKAGGDAAGLAFEALEKARANGSDILLIDTAGRLQNKTGLMAELEKIARVIKKLDASAPHAVLLVLDATTGQNALSQVEAFSASVPVTGLIMTKLDGTAKGGILVALAGRFGLPVHYIGVGEGEDDLQPFVAADFARALVGAEEP